MLKYVLAVAALAGVWNCWQAGAEFILPPADEDGVEPTDGSDGDDEPAESDDTTAPIIAVTWPQPGWTFGSPTFLWTEGTASDNIGVVAVFVTLDAQGEGTATGTTAWSQGFSNSPLTEGAHTLSARAVDSAGNSGTSTLIVFTVDGTPPTAKLIGLPAAVTAVGSLEVIVSGTDVEEYRYQIDASPWSSDRSAENWIMDDLGDGNHTLSVLGIDAVGNVQDIANATTYTWRIDQTAPALVSIEPANGGIIAETDSIHLTFDEPVELSDGDVDELLGTVNVSSDGNVVTLAPIAKWSNGAVVDYLSVTDQVGQENSITLTYAVVDGVYHVSTAGSDTNAGTRAAPFRTIQRAIVASNAYAAGAYRGIAVAEGNYTVDASVDDNNATNAFIYGGYSNDWLTRDVTRTTALRDASAGGQSMATLRCTGAAAILAIDGLTIYSATTTGAAVALRVDGGGSAGVHNSAVVGLGTGGDAFAVKVGASGHAYVIDSAVLADFGWAIYGDGGWLNIIASRISGATSGLEGAINIGSGAEADIINSLIAGTIQSSGATLDLIGNTISGKGGNAIWDAQSSGRIQNNLIFGFDYGVYATSANALLTIQNNAFATGCAFRDSPVTDYCSAEAMDGNLSVADGNIAFVPEDTFVDANGTDGDALTLIDKNWRLHAAATCDVRQGGRPLTADETILLFEAELDHSDVPRTAALTCGPTNNAAAGWSMGAWEQDN